MALVFQKINEFLDTIDKLYRSRFFAIRRCKPRKTSNIGAKMHPETHQNATKSALEKTMIFVIDFGMIWASKMFQHDTKIDQNGTLGLPKGPLGPLGGAMGLTRCLKTDFWLQFGTPMSLKWPQNDPTWPPNGPK